MTTKEVLELYRRCITGYGCEECERSPRLCRVGGAVNIPMALAMDVLFATKELLNTREDEITKINRIIELAEEEKSRCSRTEDAYGWRYANRIYEAANEMKNDLEAYKNEKG